MFVFRPRSRPRPRKAWKYLKGFCSIVQRQTLLNSSGPQWVNVALTTQKYPKWRWMENEGDDSITLVPKNYSFSLFRMKNSIVWRCWRSCRFCLKVGTHEAWSSGHMSQGCVPFVRNTRRLDVGAWFTWLTCLISDYTWEEGVSVEN